VAGRGTRAETVPFLVPDVEELTAPFAPPLWVASGVSVWLVPARADRGDQALDPETRASLRALGYLR
jgi:hypothetical protein